MLAIQHESDIRIKVNVRYAAAAIARLCSKGGGRRALRSRSGWRGEVRRRAGVEVGEGRVGLDHGGRLSGGISNSPFLGSSRHGDLEVDALSFPKGMFLTLAVLEVADLLDGEALVLLEGLGCLEVFPLAGADRLV